MRAISSNTLVILTVVPQCLFAAQAEEATMLRGRGKPPTKEGAARRVLLGDVFDEVAEGGASAPSPVPSSAPLPTTIAPTRNGSQIRLETPPHRWCPDSGLYTAAGCVPPQAVASIGVGCPKSCGLPSQGCEIVYCTYVYPRSLCDGNCPIENGSS